MGDLVGGIISNPATNIHDVLSSFASKDPFMARLIDVSKAFAAQKARGEPVQNIHCLILRSDYMFDQPTNSIKLVEYNTIACSFGCLSKKVKDMQNYIFNKYGDKLPFNYGLQGAQSLHMKYV